MLRCHGYLILNLIFSEIFPLTLFIADPPILHIHVAWLRLRYYTFVIIVFFLILINYSITNYDNYYIDDSTTYKSIALIHARQFYLTPCWKSHVRLSPLIKKQKLLVSWSKEVWFSGGVLKHKTFAWLKILDRNPTKDRLARWGLQTDTNCLLCSSNLESRSHLFFDYSYSWKIWKKSSRKCSFIPQRNWDHLLVQL